MGDSSVADLQGSGAGIGAPRALNRDTQLAKAVSDIAEGLTRWGLWGTMGLHDIRQRYRRSIIGPFWLTLSMGIMVATLGFLYSGLFGQPFREYLPFLALGLVVWSFIASLVLEGCGAFIASEGVIRNMRTPLTGHVLRIVWRNLIVFGHNIIIYLLIVLIFGLWPTTTTLLAIPGLLILCINGIWTGMLLGLISTRYRDVPPIVASIVQIFFLLSPILWKKEQLSDYQFIVQFNPFYHFVEIVRMPLLGQAPAPTTWLVVLGITLLGCIIAFGSFVRYRGRIAYWV